jgi:predicted esterase
MLLQNVLKSTLAALFLFTATFNTLSQTVIHYDSGYTLRNNQLGHYYKMANFSNEALFREYTYWKSTGAAVDEFLNFRVVFPTGYNKNDASKKYPLIVMLHGAGESGRSWEGHYNYGPEDPQFDNNSTSTAYPGPSHVAAVLRNPSDHRAFPGIVIIPQVSHSGAWQNGWEDGAIGNNIRMTIGIIEYFISNYHVDRDRIAIHGLSNGAKGVWDAAAKRPDLFAAMLPMSGVGSNYGAMSDILVTMPIWLFQGGTDTNPKPQASEDLVDVLKSKGANPIYTLYPTLGHNTWTTAYAETDFFSWILAQNKKNIYVFGGQTELCANSSIKLGFSDGFIAYQWTFNGIDISGATSRFYTLNQAGTYTVKFKRSETEWDESFPIEITPKEASTYKPELANNGTRIIPIDFNGTKNDTLRLIAPEGFPEYHWYKNGVAFDTTVTNTKVAYFLQGSGTVGTTSQAGEYAVRVKENSGCESLLSDPITVSYTSPHVAPNAPTLAAGGVTAASESEVNVQWTDNSDNEEYFEIWRNRANVNGYSSEPYRLIATVPANTNTYHDTGLRPSARYFYRVRSAGAGDGKFATAEVYITMPNDTTKPAPPTNLVVTDVQDTQISITWDASSDDDQVSAYEVYLGSTLVTTVNATTYTFSSLAPSTKYFINVRAVDTRGNFSDFPGEAIPVTTLSPQNGLTYYYYEPLNVPTDFTLATFFSTAQTPATQGVVSNFDISVRNRDIKFVFAFEGYIEINQPGNYIFYSRSDDGSRVYIDGVLQIDNDALHDGPVEKNKTVNFATTGKYPIRVEYFYANSLLQTLSVTYDPPGTGTGLGKQVIPDSLLFRTSATPVTYYCKATGDLHLLSTWGTEANGEGTAPVNFSNAYEYFHIRNRTGDVAIASPWSVAGAGSKIIVESGVTLNINEAVTGTIEADDNTVININHDSIPAFGTLSPTSTVNFNANGMVPNSVYGNLNLTTASTTKTLPLSSISVKGDLRVDENVVVQGSESNRSIISVEGDMTFLGAETGTPAGQLYSVVFKGSKDHTLTLNPDTDLNLYQLVLDYGDALTLQNSAGSAATIRLGNSSGGGLTLNTGAQLHLDKNNLVLSGKVAINPNGETGVIAARNSNLTINTTSALSSNIAFSEQYDSLTNITLSSSSTGKFNLQSSVKVKNLVTLTKGELNSYSGNLTLVSDKNGSARIGPLLSGARITGQITYQRYMDGEGRIYRYIASPVKAMSVADIQEYIPVTGSFKGQSTGSGINSSSASLFSYNEPEGGWLNFPPNGGSNEDSLRIGKGYSIFVREATDPTTWQVTGNPYQGNFIFTLTGGTLGQDNGWNLLGNPYPAPIQWTGTADTKWSTLLNVSSTVYVRENFGSEYRWRVWNGSTGNLANGIIAPGQSFWVQTTSATPTLTITENAKYTTDGTFYREGNGIESLEISMSNGTWTDETYIQTIPQASNSYNKYEDALKQNNTYFNLASRSIDSVALAINAIAADYCQKRIPLVISNAAKGNYTFHFKGTDNLTTQVYLEDALLKKHIDVSADPDYSFAITDAAESKGTRFTLILARPEIHPTATMTSSAVCESNAVITLNGTQAGVGYQAFLEGKAVSERRIAEGESLQLEADYNQLYSGIFNVSVKAGYGSSDDCPVTTLSNTILVTIDSLATPRIAVASGKIFTEQHPGYYYQWYLDGALQTNETASEIIPLADGNYSVAVTNGSCFRMSETLQYTSSGELPIDRLAIISPNPFTDKLTVTVQIPAVRTISLSNMVGRVILEKVVTEADQQVTFDLTDIAQGTYILSIGEAKYKVVKKT